MNHLIEKAQNIQKLAKDLEKALPSKSDTELGLTQEEYNPLYFQQGDWDCEDSPTGMCMYTNHEYDACIFCYQPEERK